LGFLILGGENYNKQIKFSELRKISNMSGRVMKTANKALKYFTNPLVQGKYQVVPPPQVPDHIIRPPYINNPNPQFGKYEGRP